MAEKSIRQQVLDRVKSVDEKVQAGEPVAGESEETKAFVASATAPEFGADAGGEEAPEAAENNAPEESVPLADAAPAAQTDTAPKDAAAEQQSTVTGASSTEDEWEDGEYEDSSTGYKYHYKARKGESDFLKKGQMMRADYSRKTALLKEFQDEFLPSIESGYMKKVMPVYKAIDSDPILAEAVSRLYQQRMSNQPLSYHQPGYEPQPQQQQVQPQVEQPYSDDPYLQAAMQPLVQRFETVDQRLQRWEQAQQQQAQQQQQRQQQDASARLEWQQVHQTLAQHFPNEFSYGRQEDVAKLARLAQYADQSGFSRDYYGPIGRIIEAKRQLDASAPRGVAQQQATPSAAAQSVAAAQSHAEQVARQARQEVANGTVVSSHQTPDPKPVRRAPSTDKNGKPLPIRERVKNAASYVERRANG